MVAVNDIDPAVANEPVEFGSEKRIDQYQLLQGGPRRCLALCRQRGGAVHVDRKRELARSQVIRDDMNVVSAYGQRLGRSRDAQRRSAGPGQGAGGNDRDGVPAPGIVGASRTRPRTRQASHVDRGSSAYTVASRRARIAPDTMRRPPGSRSHTAA